MGRYRWKRISGLSSLWTLDANHYFYNEKGLLRKEIIPESEGLWFTLVLDDLNGDNVPEIVAGNFGNNHSLKCNPVQPLMLYIDDFDINGQTESLLTYVKNNKRYIFPNRDMFVGQVPGKRNYFLKIRIWQEKPFLKFLLLPN